MKKVILGLGLAGILGSSAFAFTDNYSITQNMATRYKMELSDCYSVLRNTPSQSKYFSDSFIKGNTGLEKFKQTSYNETHQKNMLGGGYNRIYDGSSAIITDAEQLLEVGLIIAGGLKNGLEHVVIKNTNDIEKIERQYPNIKIVLLEDISDKNMKYVCPNVYVAMDIDIGLNIYDPIIKQYGGAPYFNGNMSSYKVGPLLFSVDPVKLTAGGYTIYSNDSDSYLGYTFSKGNSFMKNGKK